MSSLSPEVEHLLLSAGHKALPLIQTTLQPDVAACGLRSHDTALLFPGARHGHAALAGLLLRLGCWHESHQVAQNVHSAEGSYWHAITHRMEPDSSNAAYWFRQVGTHAIFPDLRRRADQIIENSGGLTHWRLKSAWDPFLFGEWFDEAIQAGGQAEATAKEIQMAEWQLLFDWCTAENASPRF